VRAEDIVGVSFFAVLISGLVLFVVSAQRKNGSQERTRWQARALGIVGFAFVAFGLTSGYFIRSSPRPVVEGNMWGIRQAHGKSAGSSFRITTDSGQVAEVRSRYDGPGFREGERARVQFVQYNHKLLELSMLSGPYENWRLQESSGEWSTWLLAGLGALCWIGSYRQLRKAGSAGTDRAVAG
jgi:hypothetical protein